MNNSCGVLHQWTTHLITSSCLWQHLRISWKFVILRRLCNRESMAIGSCWLLLNWVLMWHTSFAGNWGIPEHRTNRRKCIHFVWSVKILFHDTLWKCNCMLPIVKEYRREPLLLRFHTKFKRKLLEKTEISWEAKTYSIAKTTNLVPLCCYRKKDTELIA